ncbi:MAG: hypothetical protein K0Q85_1074 [Caproiciproducens sp.]|nr:hypothetical protein [Caproiciproducens sp.]
MNTTQEIGADSAAQTTGASDLPQTLRYGQTTIQKKKEIPIPFENYDAVFALLALVCGYLFVWLINPYNLGLGVTLFTVVFCGIVLFYAKKRGVPISRQSNGYLALILLSALNFSLFSNVSLQFLNLLFLMGCAAYWVAVLASTRLEKSLGGYFLPDMMNQLFKVPFYNFGCAVKIIKGTAVKNKKSKMLLTSLCGALAAIPLICVVISLLIQADAAFQSVMQQVTESIGVQFANFLLRLLPAFLTGSYLFGLLYGNLQKRRVDTITAEKAANFSQRCKKLPAAASITALCLLCGVYLFFFGTQTASLFSAFSNQRPDGITYAEYARRGFFELCKVAFINLGVTMVSSIFTVRNDREQHKVLRIVNVVLSVETLLLIATAISKMVMYIDRYGLTQKRVYTSWFMVLLFIVFCMLIVSQFKKINLTKNIVVAFAVCFMLLCYSNVDGIIVKYNIGRYQNGTLQTVDVNMMYNAPDASKPYALELYHHTEDLQLKAELKEFLQGQNKNVQPFQEINLQQLLARHLDVQ